MKFIKSFMRLKSYILVIIIIIFGIYGFGFLFTRYRTSDVTTSKQEKESKTQVKSIDNQTERLNRIHNVCQNRKTQFHARHLINHDKQTNIAYCYLPKCGCTFWKQVYVLWSKMDTNGNIPEGDSTFDIERTFLHKNSKVIQDPNESFFKKSINFMFVREPYSRLWSAYLDKFFLPEFWDSFAIGLKKEINIKSACSHDVTFKEFIEHVISGNNANEHWIPMIKLCDPCVFRPRFVGKIESFSDDRDRFLHSVGQEKLLDHIHKRPDHSRNEIELLVKGYYISYVKGQYWKCISQNDFNQRIWTIFQLNGHIPSNISFNPIIPRNASEMIMYINSVLKSASLDKVALKQQKKQAMIDAYKYLPKQLIEKLSEFFKEDFEMFGYDPRPKKIFD